MNAERAKTSVDEGSHSLQRRGKYTIIIGSRYIIKVISGLHPILI